MLISSKKQTQHIWCWSKFRKSNGEEGEENKTIANIPYIFEQKQRELWQETRTIYKLTIITRLKRNSSWEGKTLEWKTYPQVEHFFWFLQNIDKQTEQTYPMSIVFLWQKHLQISKQCWLHWTPSSIKQNGHFLERMKWNPELLM